MSAESENARLEMLSVEKRNAAFLEKQKTAKVQREQLAQIYRSYREIGDFAANPSVFIVVNTNSQQEMNDTLHFSVPEGEYVFWFQMTKADDASTETVEAKKFEFPLKGPGGFRVRLLRPIEKGGKSSDPRRLELHIESNRDDFQPVSEDLLAASQVDGASSSFRGIRTPPVAFPNQTSIYARREGEGVQLNAMQWSIKQEKKRYKLKFEMRLLTEGPKVIPATEFSRHYKGNFTYAGNGKYIVEQEEDPSED